jgi:hypothetical protein
MLAKPLNDERVAQDDSAESSDAIEGDAGRCSVGSASSDELERTGWDGANTGLRRVVPERVALDRDPRERPTLPCPANESDDS